MRPFLVCLCIPVFTITACQSTTVGTSAPVDQAVEALTLAPAIISPSETPSPTETATPTVVPAGFIQVDTLEQEVYPFVENGKCSLAEAIFAANSGQPKDSCAAGVPDQSIIELMPGEYRFMQRDQTPPQGDWVASTVKVGDALPAVIRSLTIRGNGATLIREEAAEPFRFFEVMFGTLTLENLTLQNGDVLDDWGGAIYSMNASLMLDHVRFVNNHADNGGGFYLTLGGLTVKDSEFVENRASFAGGGTYVDSAKAEVITTTFDGNLANGPGAGLFAENVALSVEDSLFVRNKTEGTRGGGLYVRHVNLAVTRSQFYENHAEAYGGGISVNNPIINGTDTSDDDPIDNFEQLNPLSSEMLTMIPGLEATLEAHSSGMFQELLEAGEIHDSCFANNTTNFEGDPNWTSAIGGMSEADSNYWGDPSGPSGMGPGTGDNVGKKITSTPFLTVRPEYCDLDLSEQR